MRRKLGNVEFTRGIKSRSEIYRQREKVCDGVGSFRTPTLRYVVSRRKYRITMIRRDGDQYREEYDRNVSIGNKSRIQTWRTMTSR